jgi:hypothetical protein
LNPVKDSARCLKGNLIKSNPLILFLEEDSYHIIVGRCQMKIQSAINGALLIFLLVIAFGPAQARSDASALSNNLRLRQPSSAVPCGAIVGQWRWFTGGCRNHQARWHHGLRRRQQWSLDVYRPFPQRGDATVATGGGWYRVYPSVCLPESAFNRSGPIPIPR